MDTLEYKGYQGSVEYDITNDLFYGKILNIRDLITYESLTLKEIKQSFQEAVDDYIKDITCTQ